MAGYNEVLQVMGAMIIFSMVLMNANRYMLMNTQRQVETEMEMMAVTLAQDMIDDARLRPFDTETVGGPPINIPDGFSDQSSFGRPNAMNRSQLQVFDDFHNYQEVIFNDLGEFTLSAVVRYVESDLQTPSAAKTTHKQIQVTVNTASLRNAVTVGYVRTYNFDN